MDHLQLRQQLQCVCLHSYFGFHTNHATAVLKAARQQFKLSTVKFSSSPLLQPEVSEH